MQVFNRSFEILGEFDCPGVGLFGHGQDYGFFAPFGSESEFGRFRTNFDLGDVGERHRHSVDHLHDAFRYAVYGVLR